MNVGIAMLTYEQLGAQLSAIAATIFGNEMAPLATVTLPANINTHQLCETAGSGGHCGIRKGHAQPAEIESHVRLQSNE